MLRLLQWWDDCKLWIESFQFLIWENSKELPFRVVCLQNVGPKILGRKGSIVNDLLWSYGRLGKTKAVPDMDIHSLKPHRTANSPWCIANTEGCPSLERVIDSASRFQCQVLMKDIQTYYFTCSQWTHVGFPYRFSLEGFFPEEKTWTCLRDRPLGRDYWLLLNSFGIHWQQGGYFKVPWQRGYVVDGDFRDFCGPNLYYR